MRVESSVAVCIDSLPPLRIAAFPTHQPLLVAKDVVGRTRLDGESSDVYDNLWPSLEDNQQDTHWASHTM